MVFRKGQERSTISRPREKRAKQALNQGRARDSCFEVNRHRLETSAEGTRAR